MKQSCSRIKAFNLEGIIVNVRCKSWNCPYCGRVNAKMWAWRVRIHVEGAEGPAFFWTLTLRGKYKTAKTGYAALPKLWDTFRKLVQRAIKANDGPKEQWSYCAFVEGQPRRGNMPHFHVISMKKSPYRLKDMAMQAGFGFQAKEVKIEGPKAANYVAKYASKQGADMPKSFRRVRASRDWAKLPDYQGDVLLVKSRKETFADYFIRVYEETGIDPQILMERWGRENGWDEPVD